MDTHSISGGNDNLFDDFQGPQPGRMSQEMCFRWAPGRDPSLSRVVSPEAQSPWGFNRQQRQERPLQLLLRAGATVRGTPP